MDSKLDFLTKDLIDQAVIAIDNHGIPSKRGGTDYAVNIKNKQYPYKLLVTEAAKLAGVNLSSNDFGSSENNRLGFQDLTKYEIINLKHKITFDDFQAFIIKINKDFNSEEHNNFSYHFQQTRKKIFKKGSTKNNSKVFNVPKEGSDYVFHLGGSLEIQFHIFFRNNIIGYGLGFNTQYVPMANDMSMIEYTRPIANSYLSDPNLEKTLKSKGFDYLVGSKNMLEDLVDNEYVLIGKEIPVVNNNGGNQIFLSEYQNLLSDFKGILFETYKEVSKNSIKKLNMAYKISEFIEILEYKKQIILQGPPGTGKTYTAKDVAEQILTGNVSENKGAQATILNESNQFELIQFHPSYTYEDFVRGIVAESNDGKIAYRTINKSFGEFAEAALENYNLSRKDNTEANIKKWIDDKFEEFKNEIEVEIEENEIKLSENVTIFEVSANSFKYGKNWKISSNLNFQEIKKLIKAVVENKLVLSNQQIPKDLSVHAHYRYTYYNALLALFFDKFEYKEEATKTEEKKFVLVIDEINRANLPSVLGELIYALEYRGQSVNSMYKLENGNTKITIPENLYVIGTMNTADRSVGHIDYAIRRRFAFKEVLPKELNDLKDKFKKEEFETVSRLFVKEIKSKSIDLEASEHLSPEFADRPQDVWLGHSYFIEQQDEDGNQRDFKLRLDYEIIPILEEYIKDGILNDTEAVKKILKELSN